MERKTVRFTCYRKVNSDRATIKVSNDADEKELADWFSKRVSELRAKESKPKTKKAKKDA